MIKLTVILPAAGRGTRLNLPYPKEILKIDREKALIDSSFDLFSGVNCEQIEFVIVINEYKTEIVKYLSKYKSKYNLSFTYQKPNELEYTGAIKSAKHLFGENNLVLLPDTILTLPNDLNVLESVDCNLNQHGFTFFFKPETDEAILETKGCLHVDRHLRVLDYEDKPFAGLNKFNGYWCAFAFKKNVFDDCISFMEQSNLKTKKSKIKIGDTPLYNSKVIEVIDYKDLGTWGELKNLLSRNKN